MILPFSGGSAEAEEPHPGETVALEAIAVNPAGGGFLKTGVTLQVTEDAVERATRRAARPSTGHLPVLAGATR